MHMLCERKLVNVYAHNINKRSGKRTALRSVAAEVWARKALRLLTYNIKWRVNQRTRIPCGHSTCIETVILGCGVDHVDAHVAGERCAGT